MAQAVAELALRISYGRTQTPIAGDMQKEKTGVQPRPNSATQKEFQLHFKTGSPGRAYELCCLILSMHAQK
jgi:hypothetical protein